MASCLNDLEAHAEASRGRRRRRDEHDRAQQDVQRRNIDEHRHDSVRGAERRSRQAGGEHRRRSRDEVGHRVEHGGRDDIYHDRRTRSWRGGNRGGSYNERGGGRRNHDERRRGENDRGKGGRGGYRGGLRGDGRRKSDVDRGYFRGGSRRGTTITNTVVGFRKLTQWNEIENPDELAVEVLGAKDSLDAVINETTIRDVCIKLLIDIFAKCCKTTARQVKITILAILRDSILVKESIPNYMKEICLEGTEEQKKSTCENLLQLMTTYLKLFPSRFNDMPVDSLIIFVTKIKDGEALQLQINELEDERDNLHERSRQPSENTNRNKGASGKPPPNDYREIETYPTSDEIHSKVEPYLRPIKELGAYDDGAHYLDVQFRLLKEDLVAPLREGIQEVISNLPSKDKKHALTVYDGIEILHTNCTSNGMTHCIRFRARNTRWIQWQHSKKLIFGSLLCISNDNFKTMVFATVADRNPEGLEYGTLDIRFVEGFHAQNYFRGTSNKSQMVESASYFEAYKHVLDGIKEIDQQRVPLEDYIIRCNKEDIPPQYLIGEEPWYNLNGILKNQAESLGPKYIDDELWNDSSDEETEKSDIEAKVPILRESSWPKLSLTTLNESQYKAYKHALTNEFAVIHGPPGTGKTYVGLHIADTLLRNKKYWNDDEKVPMLIVCYTNHALDQFLEGLIELGHRKIIRVGGRAKDELDAYSTKNAVRMVDKNDNRGIRKARTVAEAEKRNITLDLLPCIDGLKKLHTNRHDGYFLHLQYLRPFISEAHLIYFREYDHQCRKIKISVFDIFLDLIKIPPENLSGMQQKEVRADENEVEHVADNQVDIDGEGGVLVDRWATDENLYKRLENKQHPRNTDRGNGDRTILTDKDGFQIQQPSKRERKRYIYRHFMRNETMDENEANEVVNPWQLSIGNRWRLYQYWLSAFARQYEETVERRADDYENACKTLKDLNDQEEEMVMKNANIVAMTTTCAAKYRRVLNNIKPKLVIIEEAAEVLEAHVITSLNPEVKHVILIGDHKQLKPNPSVYKLAKKYQLEVSLFERMVNNGLECQTLNIQHRMRPEIARLIRHVYPTLQNHEIVETYPHIKGVSKNVVFISHNHIEEENEHLKSKVNIHEAKFVTGLCRYLLQQGYSPSRITILTCYTGQSSALRKEMPKDEFQGVRVTTVDNFQGEENDIILLSLVRSNLNGKIGFIGTENRVCVALSRAKHGLYVIGNFKLLEEKSPLWKNILSDVRETDSLKTHITLYCQNHPSTSINVSDYSGFRDAPEGGCTRPCEFRLECGHCCQSACHPKDPGHSRYKCKKICSNISCRFGHKCPKMCHLGIECGPCLEIVEKTIPSCEHTQEVECHIDPEEISCSVNCNIIRECGHKCEGYCGEPCDLKLCTVLEMKELKCGHIAPVECSADVKTVICKEKCTAQLGCDHPCSGTCGTCKRGRLHQKCKKDCNRILVCSHLCKVKCTSECPPCKVKCDNGCVHSKCQNKCGEPCIPCREDCKWACRHKRCKQRCYEKCDRTPCNVSCNILLKCGHPCIGLCGEECPNLCRVCDRDEVEEIFFGNEDELYARFIVLRDCHHMFEVKGLDRWMETDNDDEESNIKLKECPRCKTLVRRSLRYGNAVKKTLADIEKVKKKLINAGGDVKAMKVEALDILIATAETSEELKVRDTILNVKSRVESSKKINGKILDNPKNHFILTMVEGVYFSKGSIEVRRISEVAAVYNHLQKKKKEISKRKHKIGVVLLKDLEELKEYLENRIISDHQLRQAVVEIQRMNVHSCVEQVFNEFELKEQIISDTNKARLEEDFDEARNMFMEFEGGDYISKEKLDCINKSLEILQKRWGVSGDTITKEEKEMIIKAVGLSSGHWYKCQNGHVYAIGECGGANEIGRCPECKEQIGGESHQLAGGNEHAGEFDGSRYAVYSEEANNPLNWDQEMLRMLQME